MDHLPKFQNATRPYPTVPYLGVGDYKAKRFQEYASSHGWDVMELQQGRFSAPADRLSSRAAFLQDWLYFGLLHELFAAARKKAPRVKQFIQDADTGGEKTVTSRRLERLIQKSVSSMTRLKQKEKEEGLGRLGEALDIANSVVRQLWLLASNESGKQCPLPTEIVLSLMVLGSSIDKALQDVGFVSGATARDWNLAEAAKLSMQTSGWCRRDIALTDNFLSDISMFCASLLQRGPIVQANHGGCIEAACKVRQTDEATYQTKHVTDECNCEFWRADIGELQDIIRQDRIPYIQLRREPASETGRGPSVSASLQSMRNSTWNGPHNVLVIFSHVWSDGLGNPRENALPKCQLERFYNMLYDSPWIDVSAPGFVATKDSVLGKKTRMRRVSGCPPKICRRWARRGLNMGINIWIDTLCVPIDNEMRKAAIGMLKRYYSFATMTIVLDKELCALKHKQCSQSELLLRIGLSGWMSRCWTMQEAIVAGGAIAVRFDDGWCYLMDVVAFVLSKSSNIGFHVLTEQQRAKRSRSAGGLVAVCALLFAAVLGCSDSQDWNMSSPRVTMKCFPDPGDENYWCTLFCNLFCFCCCDYCCNRCHNCFRTMWRAVKPKRVKPPATLETLLVDCKDIFGSLSSLCQDANTDGPEYAAEAVERIELSWHGLRFRNTSHQPDRFINFAFGCAMDNDGFDLIKNLLGLPAPARLRGWLLNQVALPSGLLFLDGPKMDVHGYRWAPSDIHPGILEDRSPARCVRGGDGTDAPEGSLRLHKPGLFWKQPDTRPLGSSLVACELNSVLLHAIELDLVSVQSDGLCQVGQGYFGIVLCRPPAPGQTVLGALIANAERQPDSYTGHFICRALVRTSSVGDVADTIGAVIVQRLADYQKWTVS
ncbi:hypothetical protein HRG_008411 [Hirsutella rhossiliensis]|uniref:Heterokaryon incompatibility domain-containing protein n=1 Tax=Hirsutella rhossiliensis TaxID=111463 RepID=A0A9P8SF11_9HYPO|nr:uncharacterized protein HRG_08411 [Hirsutella rhossiliensis]KAH0960256.1 hypothetical protein HRG_08411 [Hirsutella rhossiliensis]